MPGIELSTLSGPELRRLLKLAHTRGDGPLADRLEWEIATRGADHTGGYVLPAHDTEAGAPTFRPLPPETAEALHDPEPAVQAGPERSGLVLAGLSLAAGCLIGAGAVLGLSAQGLIGRGPAPAAASEPARPAGAPVVPEALAPPASTSIAGPSPNPTTAEAPFAASLGEAVDAVARAPATRTQARRGGGRRSVTPKYPPAGTCEAAPIAADRLVCSDQTLAGLHVELQRAYDRALTARADPGVVAGQADWRRARDETSDPQHLTQLYDRRIRELNAAAAKARDREPIY